MYKNSQYLIHDSHYPFHRKMYIRLLVRCHLRPIWPPVLPLNLTYIFIFLPPLSWANLPYTDFLQSNTKSHVHFLSLTSFIQRIHPSPKPFVTFRNKLLLGWGFVRHMPNPQAGWRPIFSCRRVLIQYIRRLRTRHGLLTRDPCNMDYLRLTFINLVNTSWLCWLLMRKHTLIWIANAMLLNVQWLSSPPFLLWAYHLILRSLSFCSIYCLKLYCLKAFTFIILF
jgi:hypothetical protein